MKSVLYRGKTPVQLDGIPATAERSVEGALHFKPQTTVELTDDEWAHIQAQKKDQELKKQIVLLRSY